jgi:hypothetical protein
LMIDFPTYVIAKRGENMKKGELKPTADALSRWSSRIVPRSLHTMGQEGAAQYLADYGRGIAAPKCIALAIACEAKGFGDIAIGFWVKAFELETGIRPFPVDFSTPKSTVPVGVDISLPTPLARPKGRGWAAECAPSLFPPHLQPSWLVTMQPVDAKYDRQHYIDDTDYQGQAKKDGRRLVVIADGTDVFYQSRSTRLSSTPNIKLDGCLTALMEKIGPFVVDGEVLYYSYDGTEHRTGAQAAIVNVNAGHGDVQPICQYAIFECLFYRGVDLTDTGKIDRIKAAGDLVFDLRAVDPDNHAGVVALETFYTQEEKAFLCQYQQTYLREGEVWTHRYAKYVGGKDEQYENTVRTKYLPEFEAVILGLTPTTADGRPFGAIEIGIRDAGHLKPVGSVGTGYTLNQMHQIFHRFESSTPGTVRIMVKSQGFTENHQVWQGRYLGFAEEEE